MDYAIAVIIGILLGGVIVFACTTKKASGTLKVYIPDDPDESPYLYVELDERISQICGKKVVTFRVDTKNIKTQQ